MLLLPEPQATPAQLSYALAAAAALRGEQSEQSDCEQPPVESEGGNAD